MRRYRGIFTSFRLPSFASEERGCATADDVCFNILRLTMARSSSSLFAGAALVVALALCNSHVDAFVVVPRAADRSCSASDQPPSSFLIRRQPFAATMSISPSPSSTSATSSSLHMAAGGGKKKRRRKRKDDSSAGPASSAQQQQKPDAVPVANDEGDLPAFDLGDDEQVEDFKTEPSAAAASSSASSSSSAPSSPVASATSAPAPVDASANPESVDMSDPKVLEAMRGSQRTAGMGASGSSMDELLSNRDLEKSFKFDDSSVKEDLPSLGQVATKGRGGRVVLQVLLLREQCSDSWWVVVCGGTKGWLQASQSRGKEGGCH